jgi:hypothetical protein
VSDKKDQPPRFIFKDKYPPVPNRTFDVSVASDPKDEYGHKLCEISAGVGKSKGLWRITATVPHDYLRFFQHACFPSKEVAAEEIVRVLGVVEQVRQNKPLPDDVERYLAGRARDLRDEERKHLGAFLSIRCERHQLLGFAKRNQLTEVVWHTDDSDNEAILRELLEFKVSVKEGKKWVEVPLVSEAGLYNLIGKDEARTFRSLLERVCNLVSPVITEELL